MKDNLPLVSISSITYNHAKYIRQCIEGFLMQKTTFLFEILIHDDASTDGTAEIIKEYEKKYSDFIKPIYQKENQFSKGVMISPTFNWPRAKGKYIALCEGDDYWTDPFKLQKQVDFLENNGNYGMVHTAVNVVDSNNNLIFVSDSPQPSGEVFHDLLKSAFVVTCSVCFRTDIVKEAIAHAKKRSLKCIFDYWLWLHAAMRAKIHYMPEITSAYRSHSGGITKNSNGFFRKAIPLAVLDAISLKLSHYPEKKTYRNWELYIHYCRALMASKISTTDRLFYSGLFLKKPLAVLAFIPAFYRKIKWKFTNVKRTA